MKALVTGSQGMLGREVVRALYQREGVLVSSPPRERLDVTQAAPVRAYLREHSPSIVYHCAAMTAVNDCTTHPEEAYRQNALGTANLARACGEVGARFVYISTDYVFDGEKHTPYSEWDAPRPINVYGQTKWAGEQLAFQNCPDTVVVRTQWLYGNGNCFPNTVLARLRAGQQVKVIPAQYGAPTWARDVADLLTRFLSESWPNGIYHVTARGQTSWLQVARFLAEHSGLDPALVEPFRGGKWDDTRRPTYSVLDHQMLRMLDFDTMDDWRERLAAYLNEKDTPGTG